MVSIANRQFDSVSTESTELAWSEVKDGTFGNNKGISHGRQRFYFSGDGS